MSTNSINTTVTKGKVRTYPIVLTNTGIAETGKITVSLPAALSDFISLATPATMPSLATGDSATVMLKFNAANYDVNVYQKGSIAINCSEGNGKQIGFNVKVVSEEKGNLRIRVRDENTIRQQRQRTTHRLQHRRTRDAGCDGRRRQHYVQRSERRLLPSARYGRPPRHLRPVRAGESGRNNRASCHYQLPGNQSRLDGGGDRDRRRVRHHHQADIRDAGACAGSGDECSRRNHSCRHQPRQERTLQRSAAQPRTHCRTERAVHTANGRRFRVHADGRILRLYARSRAELRDTGARDARGGLQQRRLRTQREAQDGAERRGQSQEEVLRRYGHQVRVALRRQRKVCMDRFYHQIRAGQRRMF